MALDRRRVAEELKETGRVEAFSDGVFAIAITLLILEISIPKEIPKDSTLVNELKLKWPDYVAFLGSFATIGIMWINHHRLFNLIKRSDHTLLVLNTLLLLGVTVTPFTTGLVAEHWIDAPVEDQRTAAIVYSGVFIVIAISFNLLWLYASRGNRLLDMRSDPKAVRSITVRYAFGPICYLTAFGLGFFDATASILMNLALAVFFALPPPRARAETPEG